MATTLKQSKMLRSSNDKNFIRLGERSPILLDLVDMFDLTNKKGQTLPDIRFRNELQFSLFWRKGDNTKTTIPRKVIGLEELVNIIKSPWLKSLPKIERPYITPYGTFNERNNASLITFNSDLVALDYDKLNPEELNYLSMFWELQPNAILSLISPSGNGLKVLVRAKHGFTPETLYNGLKSNSEYFVVSGIKPDLMQFVLSQPMFIPYSENPYFNPYAICTDYGFTEPEIEEPQEFHLVPIPTDGMERVNSYFVNRVNMILKSLEERPKEQGTHQYLYSVLKRIFPYINQQTAISEQEIVQRLESIILSKYGDRSQIGALHRSIERARHPEQSLVELINQTAKVKI
jgi:hypothetical protein